MRKSLALLILLLLSTLPLRAQIGGGSTNIGGGSLVIGFAGVPSGTCGALQLAVNTTNGNLYTCNGGTWTLSGGGGGSGTITAGTTNTLPKYTAATTVGNSLFTDDATNGAYSGTGGFSSSSVQTAGLHAGYFQCGPGSSDSAAPSIVALNWQLVCPASITGWQLKIPAAAATGLPHYTNSSNVVTESISLVAIADLSATGTPSSTTFLRGDNSWATPASISGLTTNTIPKATSSTAIGNSLLTDDATSLTYAGTRIVAPAGTDSGSGGGTCTPGIGFNSLSGFTIDIGLILCSAGSTMAYTAGNTFNFKSAMVFGWTSARASFDNLDTTLSREAAGIVDVGTTGANSSGSIRVAKYLTSTNCSNAASPAICAAASAGVVAVPTGTNPTLTINTTAVTATSEIFLQIDESVTIAATTCNSTLSTLVQPVVTARTAGTSFTIQIGATIATNPACVSYHIVN